MRSTVILILGMHRSGTSCLAGALRRAGLFSGEIISWSEDNLQGNQESKTIMDLNSALLKESSGSWDNPPREVIWNVEHAQKRDKLIAEFNAHASVWMFKEPRTLLTLPFWQEGINSDSRILAVCTFRHPAKVALSLYQRSQMPLQKGIKLWLHYNQKLLSLFQQTPCSLICYDLPEQEYKAQLRKIVEQLNRQLPKENKLSASAAQEFYSEELVNHKEAAIFTLLEESADSVARTQKSSLQEEAEALYRELCKAAELPIPAVPEHAKKLYIPLSDTVEAYQQALTTQPDSPQLHFMLGNTHRQKNELEAAIASYRKALSLNHPQPFDIYRLLGKTLEDAGENSEAIAAYQQGMHQTAHPQLYKLLARLLTKAKQYDKAEKILQQLIALQPGIAHHKIMLGNLYLQQKEDLDAAAETFQQALLIEPEHYIAQKHLGITLMRQNKLDDALSYLLSAQKQHPQQSEIHSVIGQCYLRQKRWQAAADSYQQAITSGSNRSAGIYFRLGVALQGIGQHSAAKTAYEEVLQIEAGHKAAQRKLAQVYDLINNETSMIEAELRITLDM